LPAFPEIPHISEFKELLATGKNSKRVLCSHWKAVLGEHFRAPPQSGRKFFEKPDSPKPLQK